MKKQIIRLFVSGFVLVLLMSGCELGPANELPPTADVNAVSTQVAATLFARYTQEARLFTSTPLPSNTPVQSATTRPTNTPSVTPSVTFSPTPLILPPSNTPWPSNTPLPSVTPAATGDGSGGGGTGGATSTPSCDRAEFVSDISVPDGSIFAPEARFVKVWRIMNVGSCTWDEDYDLVFVSGESMNADGEIAFHQTVAPGEVIDLSAPMKAPDEEGTYTGNWILRNPSNQQFGVGSGGDQTFNVTIEVASPENSNLVYDFASNMCRANWENNDGPMPCPGNSNSDDGFVVLLASPHLENRHENEWTIWAHPPDNGEGYVSGTYPTIDVEAGQHFIAWVGCLANSQGCKLNFYLRYEDPDDHSIKNIGKWYEEFDGEITNIDVDLSSFAGESIRFILITEVDGGNPANANGFWFVPGIIQR